MTSLLQSLGSAIWRSSWQAALLALLVFALLKISGDRLAARWRFLLWSLVLARLLVIATPASSWSMFNLLQPQRVRVAEEVAGRVADERVSIRRPVPDATRRLEARGDAKRSERSAVRASAPAEEPVEGSNAVSAPAVADSVGGTGWLTNGTLSVCLPWLWLAGCMVSLARLMASALWLRRRLSACRPVADPAVLEVLEATSQRMGLRRPPLLLVCPESLSPCVLGTWKPRLVVPESIVTQSSTAGVQHVLAHELAHLRRGDLWTNWLLLAARVLHWFNPFAWWTVRELQTEREVACDELAVAVLGESERSAYANTILDLTADLLPTALVPSLIGLFSSARRLKDRLERLARRPRTTTIGGPIAVALLLGLALLGLTDARPANANTASEQSDNPSTKAPVVIAAKAPPANDYTIRGVCKSDFTDTPLPNAEVLLFKAEGRVATPVEIARTTTDAAGRFEFTGLPMPRSEAKLDPLMYAVFARSKGRPLGVQTMVSYPSFVNQPGQSDLRVASEKTSVSGRVVNEQGQPVVGASVGQHYFTNAGAIPGFLSSTTGADGRFVINDLPFWKISGGKPIDITLTIVHSDYHEANVEVHPGSSDTTVKLTKGCIVTGTVIDGVAKRPAAGAIVAFETEGKGLEVVATTDAAGHFRVGVDEGRYSVTVDAKDRVCVAKTDQEFLAGETVKLPDMTLTAGGLIVGQVINTATGQPVSISNNRDSKDRITINLFGPSHPAGKVIRGGWLAMVDESGRFVLRAAPGDNFPYFANTHGDRMAWDTLKQPPVVVKEGETTTYNMLITPEVPKAEKLKAARKVVDSLPKEPSERTTRILEEFRKLANTVDETELWCMLMRELVAIGQPAVPQVCQELDHTTADRTIRRLAFALRAIGDARAVPALIRSIPNTLQPPSSDYGLRVEDAELTTFMQKHDMKDGSGGDLFNFGRPDREVFGALQKLTKQDFQDLELSSIFLSEDPRRVVLQRRIFTRQAERWAKWWEANWQKLTDDAAYQKVDLRIADAGLPPAPDLSKIKGKFGDGGAQGQILSPAAQKGRYADHFLDLDTGFEPEWPKEISRDEVKAAPKQFEEWAANNGVDLMCVTRPSPDGKTTYVLRGFGLKAWEISQRDLRNIEKLVANGDLPRGPDVGELLMHYDATAKQFVPEANAAFLFVTREGNMGLLEITDHVTRTYDSTGMASPYTDEPTGVGFFKGVRFNWRQIVPQN